MARRKSNTAADDEQSKLDVELEAFGEVADRIADALREAGTTPQSMARSLAEAKRELFEERYPNLARKHRDAA